jgi:hypothetical protein
MTIFAIMVVEMLDFHYSGKGVATLEEVKKIVTEHDKRISNLETRVAIAENNITAINQKLDKIDANISKLIWLVMAAIVGAVLKQVGLF